MVALRPEILMNDLPPEFYLLSDTSVIEQLRLAYKESGVGTDNPVEQGGFIVINPTNGALEQLSFLCPGVSAV